MLQIFRINYDHFYGIIFILILIIRQVRNDNFFWGKNINQHFKKTIVTLSAEILNIIFNGHLKVNQLF